MFSAKMINRKYAKSRSNAKSRGIAFTLTKKQHAYLFTTMTHCHYSKEPFDYTYHKTNPHPKTPTLERVNPDIGYTDDNCVLVTYEANWLKNIIVDAPSATWDALTFANLALSIVSDDKLCDYMDQRPRGKQ